MSKKVYQVVCLSRLGQAYKVMVVGDKTLEQLFKETMAEQIVVFRDFAPDAGEKCLRNPKPNVL